MDWCPSTGEENLLLLLSLDDLTAPHMLWHSQFSSSLHKLYSKISKVTVGHLLVEYIIIAYDQSLLPKPFDSPCYLQKVLIATY